MQEVLLVTARTFGERTARKGVVWEPYSKSDLQALGRTLREDQKNWRPGGGGAGYFAINYLNADELSAVTTVTGRLPIDPVEETTPVVLSCESPDQIEEQMICFFEITGGRFSRCYVGFA